MITAPLALATALVLTANTPSTPLEPDPQTWAGGYKLSYFGANVGNETFTISRTINGYTIDATLEMKVGDTPPVRSVYRLDADRRFLSATYEELTDDGVTAEYTLAGGSLSVIAFDADGAEIGSMAFDAGPDAIIGGPHYVTDFYVLGALGLDEGDKIDRGAFVFGFDGWKISPVQLACERKSDRRIPGSGRNADEATFCQCKIDTGNETVKTRSWLDGDRISNRVSIARGIGSVTVRLTDPDG